MIPLQMTARKKKYMAIPACQQIGIPPLHLFLNFWKLDPLDPRILELSVITGSFPHSGQLIETLERWDWSNREEISICHPNNFLILLYFTIIDGILCFQKTQKIKLTKLEYSD